MVLKQNNEQDLENLRNELKKKNSLRGNNTEKLATEINDNELDRKNTKSFSILDKHMKDNSVRLNNSNQNIDTKHIKKLAGICDIAPTLQLKVRVDLNFNINYNITLHLILRRFLIRVRHLIKAL